MLGFFREVGIGISVGTDFGSGATWDSLYIVEDFDTRTGSTPFITGVVYHDLNRDGFYNPGEGLSGVSVHVTGASYYAVTSSSGGYSVPVPGSGTYSVTFSGAPLPTNQRTAIVVANQNAKVDSVLAPVLANISTRVNVGTGDNVLIGGFIVKGVEPKKLLLRAIGPTLAQYGITGAMQNPVLELHNSTGALIAFNDNWAQAANAQSIPATKRPPNALESAILTSLAPGKYTAIVRGANNTTGVALVEGYDLDPMSPTKLTNISTRGLVQTGNNVMIGGFIVQGQESKQVIIRVLGPSLANYGITNPLLNPTLELHNGNGALISSNDNWRSTQQTQISASGYAPANNAESAIVTTLTPGSYTAIVRE